MLTFGDYIKTLGFASPQKKRKFLVKTYNSKNTFRTGNQSSESSAYKAFFCPANPKNQFYENVVSSKYKCVHKPLITWFDI